MPYKPAIMQRRTVIKVLAGAFIGQPLLTNDSEGFFALVPFSKRHWVSLDETEWAPYPESRLHSKRLLGLRGDGVHFCTILFTDPSYIPEVRRIDSEHGRMLLDTFLEPACKCRVLYRCPYHEKMMGPLHPEVFHAL